MKLKHSTPLEQHSALPDVRMSARLREFLPAKFSIINAVLVDTAFNPVQEMLTEPPRPRNHDSDDELDLLVAEALEKDVVFGCGLTGSGADFAILLARQFHDSGKSILIVSPSIDELDFIARRVRGQITPQKTRDAGAFHIGARTDHSDRVGQPASSKADTEEKQTPIVIANLSEVATNPAIYRRVFDVIIVVEAEQATIAQIVHSACLAKQQLVILGDPYRLSDPLSGAGVPHDIFEFSGITAALQNGDNDPRLLVLPTQALGPHPKHVVSVVAYNGRLACMDPISNADRPGLKNWLRIIDTGAYLNSKSCDDARAQAHPTLATLLIAAVNSDLVYQNPLDHMIPVAIFTADESNRKLLQALSLHLPVNFRTAALTQPPDNHADHVIIDLHQPSGFGSSEADISHDFRCLTAGLASADSGATLIGDFAKFERTLPADAPARRYLSAFQASGVPVEPFPAELLVPASDLTTPSLGFYLNATDAWKQIHTDIAARQHQGGGWPSTPAANTTHLKQSVAASLTAVGTPLPAQGYRVGTSRQGETAVFIADDLFWLLGSLQPGTNGRPFVRVRAKQAMQTLAEIFN